MAHKRLTAKNVAWRVPGKPSPAVWRARDLFLSAAIDFQPEVLSEYQLLRPLAIQAADALRQMVSNVIGEVVDWRMVELYSDVVEKYQAVSGSEQAAIPLFRDALLSWVEKWWLVTTGERSWVLQAAVLNLCGRHSVEPVPLHVGHYIWSPPAPNLPDTLELPAWRGMEPLHEWRKRVDEIIDRHIETTVAVLQAGGLERVSSRPERNQHIEWAARWQVGSEEWHAFLGALGLLDREDAYLRKQIFGALAFIGLRPRPVLDKS